MKYLKILIIFGLIGFMVKAEDLTGKEILERIDSNMVIENAISISTMTIHSRMGTRNIKSKSWIGEEDEAYVEYLAPAREEGKKMLKTGDKLWIYTPEPNERIISISGHLLRQSVMGSDLSYEDFMENDVLTEAYKAEIAGIDTVDNRACYVLNLEAKTEDVNYYSRKIWVDKKRWLPLKEQRYAKSGKLLKKTEILDVFRVKERWYPQKIKFKDMLSRGEGTIMTIDSLNLDAEIPEYKFTKAALRR
jgi:outer membrane lipoprotein-sorting protein